MGFDGSGSPGRGVPGMSPGCGMPAGCGAPGRGLADPVGG